MNITDSYLFAQRDPMGDGSSGTDRKGKGRSTPRPAGDMLALDLDDISTYQADERRQADKVPHLRRALVIINLPERKAE